MNNRKLKISLALWERRLNYRQKKRASIRRHAGRVVTHEEAKHVAKWDRLIAEAERAVAHRREQLEEQTPLRLRALAQAIKLVGVMEVGGNNMGAQVLALIRENGGTGPEAWCGDFVAHCFRFAGSKVVQRGWAAVRLLGFLTGMKVISYAEAEPGDIVCFTFDHTAILKRKLGGGMIETVEGNTGRRGAVSDSRTGGDGVYIKQRSVGLVARYVRVTR
jgi:hypothetical protein